MILLLKRPKTKQKVLNQNCGFKTCPCIETAFKNHYVDISACCLKNDFCFCIHHNSCMANCILKMYHVISKPTQFLLL